MFNQRKERDVKIGEYNEELIQPKLEAYFGKKIVKLSKYHEMDFKSDDGVFYEVKKRNCKSTEYDDSMIGINKINFCDRQQKNSIFIFEFTDKILYYEYIPKSIVKKLIGGRCDRGKEELKLYAYFNISEMKEITFFPLLN
jgi:hypothetical protein